MQPNSHTHTHTHTHTALKHNIALQTVQIL